jgi:hypothetical protein
MNGALPELLAALRRTLHDAIAPELSSDYARGQLAAVEDILGKLAGMTVWSPEADAAQAQALRNGTAVFRARAARDGQALPQAADVDSAGTLQAAEAEFLFLVDWLDAASDTIAAPLHAELDTILRHALREQLLVQRKRIPLTDFGAMTAAAAQE